MAGKALSELIESVNWPYGLVLDEPQTTAAGIAAVRFYAGYGDIRSLSPIFDGNGEPLTPNFTLADAIDEDVELTDGEWSLIKPLYMLYIERDNARALEASRGLGVDVYGRSVTEIEQDIRAYESEALPKLAFGCQIVTI